MKAYHAGSGLTTGETAGADIGPKRHFSKNGTATINGRPHAEIGDQGFEQEDDGPKRCPHSAAQLKQVATALAFCTKPQFVSDEQWRYYNSSAGRDQLRAWGMIFDRDDETENCRQNQKQERMEQDDDIRIQGFWGLRKQFPTLRQPVVDGLFRRGETCNIVSPTKVGKTWMSYGLIMSIIAGMRWLGQFATKCIQDHNVRVLLIDNELHREVIANRISKVSRAMGIDEKLVDNQLDVLSLRGRLRDLFQIDEILTEDMRDEYGLIVLDSLYRTVPQGMSENDNADMARLYNLLDRIADRLNAAIVLIDHTSKGNQAEKNSRDMGVGAGAKARAADTQITFKEHKQASTYIMEGLVRSFPPVSPLCVKWLFPIWQRDESADPADVKRAGQPGKSPEAKEQAKADQLAAKDAQQDRRLLEQVDKAAKSKNPVSKTVIYEKAGLRSDAYHRALARLEGVIEEYPCKVPMPNGGKKDGFSIRRKTRSDVPDVPEKGMFVGNVGDMMYVPQGDVCNTSPAERNIHDPSELADQTTIRNIEADEVVIP